MSSGPLASPGRPLALGSRADGHALAYPCLQLTEKGRQVRFKVAAHVAQFDRIDAPDATLDVAHERLATTQSVRKRFLGHTHAGACLAEQAPQQIVFRAMDRLGHGRTWGSGQASYM